MVGCDRLLNGSGESQCRFPGPLRLSGQAIPVYSAHGVFSSVWSERLAVTQEASVQIRQDTLKGRSASGQARSFSASVREFESRTSHLMEQMESGYSTLV